MNICVTGGAGFIGTHVVKKLILAGHHVTVCDIKKPNFDSEFVKVDITNQESIEDALKNFDVIYHLAGSTLVSTKNNVTESLNSTIIGTSNVLNACKKNGIKKFVYASSVSVYNGIAEETMVDESEISHPFNTELFGAIKILAEKLIFNFVKNYPLEYVILRIGPVFGSEDSCTSMICEFIRNGLKQNTFTIWGDGSRMIQPTYVEDIAEGFTLAINSSNQIFNIISPERLSIKQIATIFNEKYGFSAKFDKEKPMGQTYPSISTKKIQNELKLKYTPFITAINRIMRNIKNE